ncbi:hypothetical protein EKD16_18515 [Streptomonospora litoralis]|uniref:Uncharacterized protein n=1 Tax=Streptomonospora litoralis TaxID=2498135 RepID=A0A4P6Q8X1_9ACTN|nr:hypothetical protein EKD16_18515 [Streptomonospora litoralis]
MRATGLDTAICAALARWRKPTALYDPAKTCTDVAIALALSRDFLADAGLLRAETRPVRARGLGSHRLAHHHRPGRDPRRHRWRHHAFLAWLTRSGRWLSSSVPVTITADIHTAISRIPAAAWSPAYNADGRPREGAWICEVTHMVDLSS